MATVALQTAKMSVIESSNREIDRLRSFIKHLSFIDEHGDVNLTKSVIKEIDSFATDAQLFDAETNMDEHSELQTLTLQMSAQNGVSFCDIRSMN